MVDPLIRRYGWLIGNARQVVVIIWTDKDRMTENFTVFYYLHLNYK